MVHGRKVALAIVLSGSLLRTACKPALGTPSSIQYTRRRAGDLELASAARDGRDKRLSAPFCGA